MILVFRLVDNPVQGCWSSMMCMVTSSNLGSGHLSTMVFFAFLHFKGECIQED
jgi:hypothetical protein